MHCLTLGYVLADYWFNIPIQTEENNWSTVKSKIWERKEDTSETNTQAYLVHSFKRICLAY